MLWTPARALNYLRLRHLLPRGACARSGRARVRCSMPGARTLARACTCGASRRSGASFQQLRRSTSSPGAQPRVRDAHVAPLSACMHALMLAWRRCPAPKHLRHEGEKRVGGAREHPQGEATPRAQGAWGSRQLSRGAAKASPPQGGLRSEH